MTSPPEPRCQDWDREPESRLRRGQRSDVGHRHEGANARGRAGAQTWESTHQLAFEPVVVGSQRPVPRTDIPGVATRAQRELRDVYPYHTGNCLDESSHFVARNPLPESAVGKAVVLAQRLQHGSLNRCLIVGGVVGDIGFEAEEVSRENDTA